LPPKSKEGEDKLFEAIGKIESLKPTFVSVTCGAGPITEILKIKRFSQMCGASLPAFLVRRMEKATSPEEARRIGIDFTTSQCEDLWRNGVRYFHFYTLNRSKAVTEILCNLALDESGGPRFAGVSNTS
jgi:5,10-methylenetetrahydrofolate reductase